MLDMEHNQVTYSDKFINFIEDTVEYYDKKIEKVASSVMKREIVVGQYHHILETAKNMLSDSDSFKLEAKKITDDIFSLCRYIDEMPNSNLMFVECKIDGERHLLVLKINHKISSVSVVENDFVRLVNQQTLPQKGAAVEEAIIVNVDNNTLHLIEKKFNIDGKPSLYLNSHYIKGEPRLTDKEKLNLVFKVIKKVNKEFNVTENDPLPLVKSHLVKLIVENQPIKVIELAQSIFTNDYNASEEVELIMKDLGIDESDEIENVSGNVDKCKLVLDEDRVIELDIEDYIDNRDMAICDEGDGTISITLSNVRDIVVK